MVLLFRFLLVMIASPFRSRCRILDPSTLRMRVWPNDLDLNLHLNNGRYLSLMDLGRVDLIGRARVLRPSLRRGWLPVIGAAKIRFRRSLGPFERYQLTTRLLCWDSKWFYLQQTFTSRNEVAAVGYVRGLFRHRSGSITPEAVLALIGETATSPPFPPEITNWIEDPLPLEARTVPS